MAIIYKSSKKSGFTLVEILAVIMVIGIIALVSLPIYTQIKPGINLNAETRDIVSDLRYAQQLSVTEQVNYSVTFNLVQNKYTVTNTSNGQIIKSKDIGQGIAIDSITGLTSNNTAIFNVTGAAIESGSITLINISNATSTISIKPSGYVKIE